MSNLTNQPTDQDKPLIPTADTIWMRLLGPNYKVRRAAWLQTLNDALLYLAIAPYALGTAGIVLPPSVKQPIFWLAMIAKAAITLKQGYLTKQKDVTGGNVMQTPAGEILGQLVSKAELNSLK